ncbi:hypothetical protein H8J56_27370, partial [Klebsiella sp. Kps]|nr:hypothetical protein [Klebsiella sp. Kps]
MAMEQKAAVEAIKASWNALSEERRMKWIKKAVKDEKRYEEEMSTYCAE